MATARLIAASGLGVVAGILGLVHGFFETQQGSVAPGNIFINAIGGTQCEPNCLPAMTIIPNFLIAGVATIIVGIAMLFWVAAKLQKPPGRPGFVLLSTIIFLTGGGFFAPVIGLIASAIGPSVKRV